MHALCAWIGAILARLREGGEPYPGASRRHPRVAFPEDAGPGDEGFSEEPRDTDAPDPGGDAESFGLRSPFAIDAPLPWETPSDPVFERLLDELHARGRGEAWEDALWTAVIWFSPRALPERVLLDLVGRGLSACRHRCAHSICPERVWFALAENWGEAVENLAAFRYRNPGASWSEVEVIQNDWAWDELLRMLTMVEPSSVEKAEGLADRIMRRNAEADEPVFTGVPQSTHPVFADAWRRRGETGSDP